MKYLLTFILSLALAGLVFAGNTGTVTQNGTGNEAYVNQTGDGHEAYVTQDGKNMATVDQYGGNGSYARIDMNATNFPGGSSTYDNGAYIEQIGNDNHAEIDIPDIGWATGCNAADIYQNGDDNEAYQLLKSHNHQNVGIDISQIGNTNYARQSTYKRLPNGHGYGNYGVQGMLIDQLGNDNKAEQFSVGGMKGVMKIYQVGNGNDFTVSVSPCDNPCTGLAFVDNPGNVAQYQYGQWSTAIINITGNYNHTVQCQEPLSGSGNNYATVDIIGDDNNSAQGQLGAYNHSVIDITGDLNIAVTSQTGAGTCEWDGNNATITQTGNSNIGCIKQQP